MAKLVRVQRQSADQGPVRFALSDDDGLLHLLPPDWSFADALSALAGERAEVGGETASMDQWELLSPVPSPASLRDCVGFLQHIRNTRRSRGDVAPLQPVWQE